MRFFVVKDPVENIAVVFHDHNMSYVLCRSKKDSFRNAFDAVSGRVSSRFKRVDGALVLEYFDVSNHDWIDDVLEKVCSSGYWKVSDQGTLVGSEENIDVKIQDFLS